MCKKRIEQEQVTTGVYFIEKRVSGRNADIERYYAWHLTPGNPPCQTLFDIKDTEEAAQIAIDEHKRGEHSTQKFYRI